RALRRPADDRQPLGEAARGGVQGGQLVGRHPRHVGLRPPRQHARHRPAEPRREEEVDMTEPTATATPTDAPAAGRSAGAVLPRPLAGSRPVDPGSRPVVFEVRDLGVWYGDVQAVRGVSLDIRQHEVTAFIGPSGCGKSTVLRCLDRMNDLVPGARVEGTVTYHGVDLYGPGVDPVEVRRRVGMVFQKPNPFPKSIYDNVAYGPRLHGRRKRAELDEIVEGA